MINEQRLLNEFLELVQIDSESGHEKVISEVLAKKLEALGLTVEKFAPTTGYQSDGHTLFARLPGTLPGSSPILVSAHMDTVIPGVGVKPQIRDGAVYSDGTTILGADDKAGIAEILEAVRTILEKDLPHREVEIVFSIGEEKGLHGARSMDVSRLRSRQAYVLDTSGSVGKVVVKAPSSASLTFEVFGRKAHAGSAPEKGISAIQVAGTAISKMKLLRIDEETTCNIGTIRSDFPNNIVPDYCLMTIGARSRNAEKLQAQIDHLVDCMQSTCDEFGATLKYDVKEGYKLYSISPDSVTVRELGEAMEKNGVKMSLGETGGGSDASIYNQCGIESVVVACGMRDIHTTDEFIEIADLEQSARVLVSLITK